MHGNSEENQSDEQKSNISLSCLFTFWWHDASKADQNVNNDNTHHFIEYLEYLGSLVSERLKHYKV